MDLSVLRTAKCQNGGGGSVGISCAAATEKRVRDNTIKIAYLGTIVGFKLPVGPKRGALWRGPETIECGDWNSSAVLLAQSNTIQAKRIIPYVLLQISNNDPFFE